MAFLGIKIPSKTGKIISEIDVPGDKTNIDELHITLLYFGKDFSLQDTAKSIEIINAITTQTASFTVKTKDVSHFEGHKEDKCAVIAKMESEKLHALRAKLAESFDEHGLEYSKEFKDYKPHTTLSYSEEEPKDFIFSPIEFTVGEITLWGGSSMDDKIIITFPLSEGAEDNNSALLKKIDMFDQSSK